MIQSSTTLQIIVWSIQHFFVVEDPSGVNTTKVLSQVEGTNADIMDTS